MTFLCFKVKISKFHIKYTIFGQNKNHLYQKILKTLENQNFPYVFMV